MIRDCLEGIGISHLGDWDVLIFLYRHPFSLSNAAQIGRLLGHPSKTVGEALERLESVKLIQRSRPLRGVRFHQFKLSKAPDAENCLRQLLSLAESRSGRLLVVKHLRQRVGLHIASKGKTK